MSKIHPEDTDISMLNRITYWWYNSFIFNVNNHNMEYKDLYDNQKEHSAEHLYKVYKQVETEHEPEKNSYYIWYSLFQVHKWNIIFSFFSSLFLTCLSFAPSLILNQLIQYLLHPHGEIYLGIALAVLLLIVPIITSVLTQYYQNFMYRFGMDVEVTLQTVLYRKLLFYQGKSFKVGEQMSLISFDARQVGKYIPKSYFLWQTPIMIWISLIMLYWFAGNAVFVGLIAMLCFLPFTILFSMLYTKNMEKYYACRDERGKLMDELLLGVKLVKFYSLEKTYIQKLNELRKSEVYYLKISAVCDILQGFVQKMIVIAGGVTTVIISALYGNGFDVAQVFTTLSFFNVLEKPITSLGENIFDASNTWISFKRIQNFVQEAIKDNSIKELEKDEEIDMENHAIIFKNANFEFDKNHQVLDGMHFNIPKGSLTAIGGETASGKSSLLQAICGNITKSSGTTHIEGTRALCSQNPWLQNASIRDNILFGKEFDEETYKRVLIACCLDRDISQLPQGDETILERNATNVPASLQQRISLARACYSNRDIILIDSIFERMDNKTQDKIFEKCIQGYLKDKTVVFVTNSNDHHTKSDKVIMLDQGRMMEKTDFQTPRVYSPVATEEVSANMDQPKPKGKEKKLIPPSEYFAYFTEYGAVFYFSLFLVLLFSGSKILLGWWISMWSADRLHLDLSHYIWGYIVISLLHSLLLPVHKMTFVFGGMAAMWKIHYQMITSVLSAPMSFFEKTQIGEILNRFMDDVMKLDYQIPSFFISFFGFTTNSLMTIAMIVIITPPSFFFILLIGILFFFVWFLARKPQLLIQEFTEISRDPITSHVSSSINGLMTIQAYENQFIFAKEFVKRLDYHLRSRWLEVVLYRWLTLRLEFLAHIIVFSCALFCVIMEGRISPAIAALAITYSLTISEQFNSAMNAFISAEGGMLSFHRVTEFTHLENEFVGKAKENEPYDWPSEGKIEFQNVKLKYEENYGLNDVTLTFGPGEVIGIIGKTGSGRSSFFVSLFRLVELAQGRILIDDVDISQVDLELYRPRLSIIPQEHLLLNGTLRNNIDPLGKFSDYLITNALDEVHLKRKLDKLGITLDDSVDVLQKLSFGEKQLIAVARCVLYDSKIIMIDDALQNVETKSKMNIERTIRGFKGKTVLIVAPKGDSILECCNKIVVMEKGRVVAYDTLEALKSDPNSEYHKVK